jgi:PAS domain S-box-containing protein
VVASPPVDAFGAAGIAMAVVEVDGRLAAVNPALCELLGRSEAELLAGSLDDVTDAAPAGPTVLEALLPAGLERHVSERRLTSRSQVARWVRITASRTTTDRPGAVLAILEDVTERRHAGLRVRAQRERLEALVVAQHAVATAGLDLDAVMSVTVEHALRLTGAEGSVVELVDGEEMVYRAAAGSTAPYVGLRLLVQGSLSGRCVLERETLICLDSEVDDRVDAAACQRIGVRSMAVVPLFRAGAAVGVLKVTSAAPNRFGPEDVQALQLMAGLVAAALAQAQAFSHAETLVTELDKRQEFLAAVLESTQAGIVACDEQGRLTLFNGITRTWHGVDADAQLDPDAWSAAYDLYEVDGVTRLPADRVPLVRALRDGQVTDAEIVIARRGAASATRVQCQGRRLQLGDRVLGAVVVMHDITAAHERELALAQARDDALAGTRAKTAFLAAASHEIRTPLNGVLGTLELLDVAGLDPQQRRYVEVARRSSEALLSLLNDVLDLSKAEATRVVLEDAPFSPNEVAADVAAALGSVARAKDLQLHVEPGAECLLMGDADRLRQILMNLVGNAVKFTSTGGVRIGVTVEAVPPGRPRVRRRTAPPAARGCPSPSPTAAPASRRTSCAASSSRSSRARRASASAAPGSAWRSAGS